MSVTILTTEKIGLRYDLDGDFDHPGVPDGSPLKAHVLYRVRRPPADYGGPP